MKNRDLLIADSITVVTSVSVLTLVCALGEGSTTKELPGNLKGKLQKAAKVQQKKKINKKSNSNGAKRVPPYWTVLWPFSPPHFQLNKQEIIYLYIYFLQTLTKREYFMGHTVCTFKFTVQFNLIKTISGRWLKYIFHYADISCSWIPLF